MADTQTQPTVEMYPVYQHQHDTRHDRIESYRKLKKYDLAERIAELEDKIEVLEIRNG